MFTPFFVRARDDSSQRNRRMLVQDAFNFDARNIFATRNDDVFQSVSYLDVAL